MSIDQSTNQNEEEHHVIKYILDKLEDCAHKSHLWRFIHASHLRRNLLRRSRHVSKIHSISEDLVRRCINQLFTDVDQYVTQLHRLLYSQQFDDSISLFNNRNKRNTTWQTLQMERAKSLFPNKHQMTDNELMDNYYTYVREKLTPKQNLSNSNKKAPSRANEFDLNLAFSQAESKAKEYLKTTIQNFKKNKTPNMALVDEMIKLGKHIY